MVRKERSLCAQRVRKVCPIMSKRMRIWNSPAAAQPLTRPDSGFDVGFPIQLAGILSPFCFAGTNRLSSFITEDSYDGYEQNGLWVPLRLRRVALRPLPEPHSPESPSRRAPTFPVPGPATQDQRTAVLRLRPLRTPASAILPTESASRLSARRSLWPARGLAAIAFTRAGCTITIRLLLSPAPGGTPA